MKKLFKIITFFFFVYLCVNGVIDYYNRYVKRNKVKRI